MKARECFIGTEIARFEIRRAIRKLKRRKAAGQNGIKNEAWKEGGDILIENLHKCINEVWIKGVVKPVYIKEEEDEASNYRGITLMDTRLQDIYIDSTAKTGARVRKERDFSWYTNGLQTR